MHEPIFCIRQVFVKLVPLPRTIPSGMVTSLIKYAASHAIVIVGVEVGVGVNTGVNVKIGVVGDGSGETGGGPTVEWK